MKLYILNATLQIQRFVYRVIESPKLHEQVIPLGQQLQIWGDDQPEIIHSIIDQHRKYGILSVKEALRTKQFCALIYAIDKPVPIDALLAAKEANDRLLTERSAEMRKMATATMGTLLLDRAREMNAKPMRSYAFEMEEQPSGPADRGAKLAEVIAFDIPGREPRRH